MRMDVCENVALRGSWISGAVAWAGTWWKRSTQPGGHVVWIALTLLNVPGGYELSLI